MPVVSKKVTESILGQVAENPPLKLKATFDYIPLEVVSKGQLKFSDPTFDAPYYLMEGSGKLIVMAEGEAVSVLSIKKTYL